MWKNALTKVATQLLQTELCTIQQIRTTFVVKRRWPPGLHKENYTKKPLRGRHYVYDLVKDTGIEKQPNIDVILVSYVDGLGNAGDKISIKPTEAYDSLLLPGLAVYATPENVEKYVSKVIELKKEDVHSSPFAQRTVNVMSKITLSIMMNKDVPWTLEAWHVRASFRKSGFHVAEEAIQIPRKPISGPDMGLEDKEFFVNVTINKMETVNVRCRIHHWSTQVTEKLPYIPDHWKIPREPLFPEDATTLETMPSKHIYKIQANSSSTSS